MAPEAVIFLGRLLRTGKLDFTRTIAVGGSEIEAPQYARVKVGAKLSSILEGQLVAVPNTTYASSTAIRLWARKPRCMISSVPK